MIVKMNIRYRATYMPIPYQKKLRTRVSHMKMPENHQRQQMHMILDTLKDFRTRFIKLNLKLMTHS